jgi:arginase family enzyme
MTGARASRRLKLNDALRIAALGAAHYAYDRDALKERILAIPTARIEPALHHAVDLIRATNPSNTAMTEDELRELLAADGLAASLPGLVERRMLVEPEPVGGLDRAGELQYFQTINRHCHLRASSFFHTPDGIADSEADVGIVGVPIATVKESSATVTAPHDLRTASQFAAHWLELAAHGAYTEIGMSRVPAPPLCRGVVLKDFGDLDCDGVPISEVFRRVEAFVVDRVVSNNVRPIFIGGDHAITFPIVHAYQQHKGGIAILHLDAHNDLFYDDRVRFWHGNPIRNLLLYSRVEHVYSFGLRTYWDRRAESFTKLAADPDVMDRIHLSSIGATKQFAAHPEGLDALFAGAGEWKFYLSIDLDVLSADCIGEQTSTPRGPGLAWYELFALVDALFARVPIVACDVTEYQRGAPGSSVDKEMMALLLLLIDRLARQKRAERER